LCELAIEKRGKDVKEYKKELNGTETMVIDTGSNVKDD
jgi:hypothetical protein